MEIGNNLTQIDQCPKCSNKKNSHYAPDSRQTRSVMMRGWVKKKGKRWHVLRFIVLMLHSSVARKWNTRLSCFIFELVLLLIFSFLIADFHARRLCFSDCVNVEYYQPRKCCTLAKTNHKSLIKFNKTVNCQKPCRNTVSSQVLETLSGEILCVVVSSASNFFFNFFPPGWKQHDVVYSGQS